MAPSAGGANDGAKQGAVETAAAARGAETDGAGAGDAADTDAAGGGKGRRTRRGRRLPQSTRRAIAKAREAADDDDDDELADDDGDKFTDEE